MRQFHGTWSVWTPHGDLEQPKIGKLVMGHSLVRSLVRSHRSLVRSHRTARFARALRCAHSLARFAFASMEISLEDTVSSLFLKVK